MSLNVQTNVTVPQNNMTFKALVPKAKYKGTPNLSESAIKGIKILKKQLVKVENDIIAKEGEIARENPQTYQAYKLEEQIATLKSHRDYILWQIDAVKNGRRFNSRNNALSVASRERKMREIDEKYLDILG